MSRSLFSMPLFAPLALVVATHRSTASRHGALSLPAHDVAGRALHVDRPEIVARNGIDPSARLERLVAAPTGRRQAGAAPVRVAIIEPHGTNDSLQLPSGANAEVVLRSELTAKDVEVLVDAAVRVVVLDLRQVCSTQVIPMMRLLRHAAGNLRIVAVTDPGDDAAAQVCVASGALAHLGGDSSPMALLRAVNAASRGAPCLGETGQRAVRRLSRDVDQ